MQALVIAAHGSHLNAGSSQPTFDHADTIRAVGAFDEVRESFWKEEPSFREVLRTVDAEEVYVVPLFISEGYFTEQVIPREAPPPGRVGPRRLGLRRDECDPHHVDSHRYRPDRPLLRAGRDARLDERRHRQAGRIGDRGPGGRAGFGLAVVGHGTERNENSAKAIEYHADRIQGVRSLRRGPGAVHGRGPRSRRRYRLLRERGYRRRPAVRRRRLPRRRTSRRTWG